MHIRILDRKVQKAVKKDAKERKCSAARAAEMALNVYYFEKRFIEVDGVPRKRVMPI